jgi:hypothetical protein
MTDFDLRNVLADRAYPTARVPVLLDDKIVYELAALHRRLDEVPVSNENPEDLERQIAAKQQERDEQAYWVHLRATSNRAREDMQREALSQFPIKADVYGREDAVRGLERGSLLSELYFAAHITKIVAPNGAEQEWTKDNGRDLARAFLDTAPEHAVKVVDAAISALRGEQESQYAKVADVDFLSRT